MIDRARELLLSVTAGRAFAPASLEAIRARAPGVVVRGETFDRSGLAVRGGLADPSLFGAFGERFARIVLAEPVQHPLIEATWIHELPVLPPALRAAQEPLRSSLEMLYVGVMRRNHRLARAIDIEVPTALLEQERRQLGRAILQLFVNRRTAEPQRDLAGIPRAGLLEADGATEAPVPPGLLFALGLEAV